MVKKDHESLNFSWSDADSKERWLYFDGAVEKVFVLKVTIVEKIVVNIILVKENLLYNCCYI